MCIASDRQRYKLSNPGGAQRSSAKYRGKFPERRKSSNYNYRIQNSDKEKTRKRNYALENPETIRMAAARRRAKLAGSRSYLIIKKDLRKLKSNSCFYCGGQSAHIDHVIPISKGGQHSIGNLVAACAFCNISKNDRFIMEWKMSEAYVRILTSRRKESNDDTDGGHSHSFKGTR
jgi:5-methylcytosine-specific restriction endonuclease McrA